MTTKELEAVVEAVREEAREQWNLRDKDPVHDKIGDALDHVASNLNVSLRQFVNDGV